MQFRSPGSAKNNARGFAASQVVREGDALPIRAMQRGSPMKKSKAKSEKEAGEKNGKMKQKDYEKALRKLQVGLCHLQEWVKTKGARVIIVFEGRDTAGKGGTIKALTERVSPRVFRVVALPAPTDRQRSQMFMQRYVPHF